MKKFIVLLFSFMLIPGFGFSITLTWETHNKKAKQLAAAGQFEEAIDYLSQQAKRQDLVDIDRLVIATFAMSNIFSYGEKKQALSVIKPIHEELVKKYGEKGYPMFWARRLLIQAYLGHGDYDKALNYAKLQVKFSTQKDKLAEAYTSLADVYRERKEFSKSLSYYLKSEHLLKQLNQNNKYNSELDTLYNNLAVTYDKLGDYQNALITYQAALKRRDKNQEGYYRTLFNMTGTYRSIGQVDKAKQYLTEISDYYLKAEGAKSFDYMMIENEIGVLEQDYGHYDEAIYHYKTVLSCGEIIRNEKITALAMKNMGSAYNNLSNYSLAETYLQKALVIYQKLPLSMDLADNYDGLAALASEKKIYKQELDYYDKSLAVRDALYQQNNPDYAQVLTNKAMAYQKQRDYKKAEELYKKSLTLLQKSQPQGQKMGFLLINRATLYVEQKEYKKAEPTFLKGIEILKQALGEKHPDVAYAYNNLATVYSSTHQKEKAVDCYKKAIAISKETEGPNHPSTKRYFRNLFAEKIEQRLSRR